MYFRFKYKAGKGKYPVAVPPSFTTKKRTMKRIILLPLIMLMSFGLKAQQNSEKYLELLRKDLKSERVAIITEYMDFTDEEGKLFWPIYREYELAQNNLGDRYLQILKDYAASYDNLTDDVAKSLMDQDLTLKQDEFKLRKKFLKRYMKVMPAKRVAQYYQLENQIDLLMDVNIASQVPLIEP